MPIYEFYCRNCHTIFNFFSSRVNTEKKPECPACGMKNLKKYLSSFATIGKAKNPEDGMLANIDESKMESVLGELAMEAGNINAEDPRQMANLIRKFSQKTGLDMGGQMEEALARLESGENPEQIEQDMGNLFGDDFDPAAMFANKGTTRNRNAEPRRDETLYEL
ncbi:MAG: zinc ribbon domain-containing protein [Proteobacteria bacterium]|nr:zinc ribbon domain-containing protein [Pseudomonadota bacterium]MBU1709246.1 zinc ribbon domain-containing protein [Pseudomonadota bacterium]